MGEKIRDIRPIHLIGSEVMIELNKGTNKHKGNLIHIQNKKFRHLLTLKDFYKLSADIMRARTEFDYIKTHAPKPLYTRGEKIQGDQTVEAAFAGLLSAENIRYRMIDQNGKVLTLIVHPEDRKAFHALMKNKSYTKAAHPYGKKYGYVFLYRMHEFDMYLKDDQLYEVFYELPCLSMTPKTWMPLDLHVQDGLWADQKMEGDVCRMDDNTMWIYRMMRCIFEQCRIYEDDLEFFRSHADIPFLESMRERMELAFFSYVDRLLELLREERYEDIINDYYSYQEY